MPKIPVNEHKELFFLSLTVWDINHEVKGGVPFCQISELFCNCEQNSPKNDCFTTIANSNRFSAGQIKGVVSLTQ